MSPSRISHVAAFTAFAMSLVASPLRAQTSTVHDSLSARAVSLFERISGHWSCSGGFSRGGSLESDMSFTPILDGRVLFYTHTDRAPNAFWESATWSLDASGRIVSMAMVGSTKTRVGAPALFIATSWSPSTITLVADTVKTPPFAPNQFTYSLAGDRLKMVWEVARNGVRAVGDSLLCNRAPGDR